ncbi:MAG TPA: hypothetical protein VEH01_00490 [Nitrososphaerales archaeon]|nr:hypothetical protein [Nitrososphaerales archaeon]
MNLVVGRALRRLVEWDRVAENAGLVVISPVTLSRLMGSLTVEQAEALGESIGDEVWMPIVLSKYGEVTLVSTLDSIDLISRYMGRFEFHRTAEGTKNVVTVRHGGGRKWSAFYLGAAKSIFKKHLGLDFVHHMSEELVTIEFDAENVGRTR